MSDKLQKISIICSKGSLDMAYPGLVLANAARMSGIEATMFFTFWGLDIINKHKVEHLHLSLLGNTSVPSPLSRKRILPSSVLVQSRRLRSIHPARTSAA